MSRNNLSDGVPLIRISVLNDAAVNAQGQFVLYWMTAFRRTGHNFSLQRAVEWAEELQKPLVILEALRCDYPWASDRIHTFVLNGMFENRAKLTGKRVTYHPYVEDTKAAGKGLIEALARRASVVMTDDYPSSFLPKMIRTAASRIGIRMEAVDSNGLLPLKLAEQVFGTAYAFRRYLQKHLPDHLRELPLADPLADARIPSLSGLPEEILSRWPPARD